MFLIEPGTSCQKSFEAYVNAYRDTTEDFYFDFYKKALENFEGYVQDLHNHSKGIELPEGWVRTSTFWLIEGDEVVGVVRVRHEDVKCDGNIGYDISPNHRNKGYGAQLLRLGLEKAADLGIEEAIVTCSIHNTASRKIIEKNGGELLGTVFDEEENEDLFRYKIRTNKAVCIRTHPYKKNINAGKN